MFESIRGGSLYCVLLLSPIVLAFLSFQYQSNKIRVYGTVQTTPSTDLLRLAKPWTIAEEDCLRRGGQANHPF